MPVMNLVDAVITFRILKLLVTPWTKTEAFRLGIIDKNGTPLKTTDDLKTSEEQSAYTVLVRLVFKLKRILGKIPLINKNLTNFAAALWLIKECLDNDKETLTEADYNFAMQQDLSEQYTILRNFNKEEPSLYLTTLILKEDAPVNNVGGGNIAGTKGDAGKKPVIGKVLRRKKLNP